MNKKKKVKYEGEYTLLKMGLTIDNALQSIEEEYHDDAGKIIVGAISNISSKYMISKQNKFVNQEQIPKREFIRALANYVANKENKNELDSYVGNAPDNFIALLSKKEVPDSSVIGIESLVLGILKTQNFEFKRIFECFKSGLEDFKNTQYSKKGSNAYVRAKYDLILERLRDYSVNLKNNLHTD